VLRVGDGRWLLTGLLQPMGKPGGHGVIWKLMRDEGVFEWMKSQVGGVFWRSQQLVAVLLSRPQGLQA
jgi:hypothetical protein